MLHQFNNHCDQHDLLLDFQSAYRKNYSTETVLIKLVNEILWAMETKLIMAVTILDLLAAFDTVDHDLLLDILNKKFGISEVALQWFENYLRSRSIKVHVNKLIPMRNHWLSQYHRDHVVGQTFSQLTAVQ